MVIATATVQRVSASATIERVIAQPPVQRVIATLTIKVVIPRLATQPILPTAARKGVIAPLAIQQIIPTTPIQRIIPAPAKDDVMPAPRVNRAAIAAVIEDLGIRRAAGIGVATLDAQVGQHFLLRRLPVRLAHPGLEGGETLPAMRQQPRPQITRQLYQIPQRLHRLLAAPRGQKRVHGGEIEDDLARLVRR